MFRNLVKYCEEAPGEPSAPTETPEAVWPEDWRTRMAGEDENEQKHIAKYASPDAIWKKARALEQKFSSGEFKSTVPFPVDGKEEDKLAWRKEHGIPETHDKYDLNIEGIEIGDEDKPIIEELLKSAHEVNLTQDQTKKVVQSFYKNQEKLAEIQAEMDEKFKNETEDALRTDFGKEYRANINRIHNLLDLAGDESKEKLINGRFADGRPFFSDPNIVKFFLDIAMQLNPTSTVVPAGGDLLKSVEEELNSMRKLMADKHSDYWEGPKAEKMQARFRELLEEQSRINR